ncbi:MAG TPA: hypothetical protein VJS92_11650 [Candidatus Polarisedimenticolaceae bacterium]|nr:hypothetical protein [Candidatus Polarisedimenticolaceae bacterium]
MKGTRIAALAVLALGSVGRADAGSWKFSVAPYAWATSIKTDVAVNDEQVASSDIEFSDLVDKVDFTAQVHAEAQRGAHGVLLDVFNVKLSDDDRTFAVPMVPGAQATAAGDFRLTVVELGGVFDPRGDQRGVALLYGARVFDRSGSVDAQFDLGPGMTLTRSYEAGDTLVDAMVGVRYWGGISDHWSYQLRVDASSGGTNLSWSAGAGVSYAFGDSGRYALVLGYRHMDIDFDPDSDHADLNVDATLSGALAGFKLSF